MKIIVPTCDKYLWIVPTSFHFYKKNWPDNPYQIEYITETIEVKGAHTFCAGRLPWAGRMIKYLESSEEDVFLLLLDDIIITERVNTDIVKQAEALCTGDIGCVWLHSHNKFSKFLIDTGIRGFKEYPLDKPYSISTQASIWQKEFFLEALRYEESIWDTEIKGSKRIHTSKKKVMWIDTHAICHVNGGYIKKGKIVNSVEQWVKENW